MIQLAKFGMKINGKAPLWRGRAVKPGRLSSCPMITEWRGAPPRGLARGEARPERAARTADTYHSGGNAPQTGVMTPPTRRRRRRRWRARWDASGSGLVRCCCSEVADTATDPGRGVLAARLLHQQTRPSSDSGACSVTWVVSSDLNNLVNGVFCGRRGIPPFERSRIPRVLSHLLVDTWGEISKPPRQRKTSKEVQALGLLRANQKVLDQRT